MFKKPTMYVLDDNNNPRQTDMIEEWDEMKRLNRDRVALTMFGGIKVSTVFLGFLHWGGMFETMVFGGKHNGLQRRCDSWNAALNQHIEVKKLVGFRNVPDRRERDD